MPRLGKRFTEFMTCVRQMKVALKGKIKGAEVFQNFAECVDGVPRPYVLVKYKKKYYKEAMPDSAKHPDKLIRKAAEDSGLIELFEYAGSDFVSDKRDVGFVLRDTVTF